MDPVEQTISEIRSKTNIEKLVTAHLINKPIKLTDINAKEEHIFMRIILLLEANLDEIDPLILENLIMNFNLSNNLTKAIKDNGDSIYEITEEAVIKNWMHFSD